MLKFLYSLFWGDGSDGALSLEEAHQILNREADEQDQVSNNTLELDDNTISQFDENYTSLGKTGFVTDIENGILTIDNLYKFKSDSPYFHKNSKVSYNIVLTNDTQTVTNVTLVENDWDVIEEKKSTWCLRTLVSKVDDRKGRKLLLNPGEITVDLDQVSSDFVPLVGDWVQLDARCELDEDVVDLNGKILEIVKIYPLRPHIRLCKVSNWDAEKYEGILSNTVYFNKDSLSGGYTPLKDDQVIAEIIESYQGRCALRALKIVPEFMKNKEKLFENTASEENESTIMGITIEKPECLKFLTLKETIKFSLSIKNELNYSIKVIKVEYLRKNSQCKVSEVINNFELTSGQSLKVACECISSNMGKSSEYFSILTDKGEINGWIQISVESKSRQSFEGYQKSVNSYRHRERDNVIKGERISAPPRFIAVKTLDYTLPKRFLDVVTKYNNSFLDISLLKEELSVMKPCLNANLSYNNYLDKFHTLLYLEEVQSVIEMSAYDQDRAVFIRNNEFLMLEIENLSERRPSIIVGDKIYAKDSSGCNNTDWEGIVHKTGSKHIFVKFSSLFHDSYDGDDYDVHVVSSRNAIRRLHQAVDLAVKNLGVELLFPARITNKDPQIQNLKENDESDKKISSSSRKETLKKLLEYNNKSPHEKEMHRQETLIKNSNKSRHNMLEWYNKSLNLYQKEAVKNVVLGIARPLPYVIFGPPGTGKTVTLVECILQILRSVPSSRLLVAAPSNSASDLIALRLIDSKVLKPGDLVRYVSFKYLPSLPVELAPYSTTGDLSRHGTNSKGPVVLENGMTLGSTVSVLGRHRITVTTCSSAGALYAMGFPKGHFSHIIIDEAGQAMEPEVMIPLVFLDTSAGQAVLAGDPLQLGPVVLSKMAAEAGLQESYVERLLNRFPYARDHVGFPDTGGYDPRLVTKLLCNYRSAPSLLKLTSRLFYNDDLIPMLSDEGGEFSLEKLGEILERNERSGRLPNIVFHGIDGDNFQSPDSPSWFNPDEASQVFFYVNELYRLGLKAKDIGIISPYVKQVKEIRSLMNEAEFEMPKIGSVEEFQGQENNVIILSTVRSNQNYVCADIKHSLGFISSPRRLNVAISRAKILLIIVGNPNLLYGDKYWQSIIDYVIENGAYVGLPLNYKIS